MSRCLLEKCPRNHLVIHMDINKTILQVDSAGRRSMEDVLNSNVADNVCGYVDASGEWKALGEVQKLNKQLSSQTTNREPLLTYGAFVDKKYRETEDMKLLTASERRAKWAEVCSLRREATARFTAPGAIGHKYAYMVEKQQSCLKIEPYGGYHSIIPSFFNLVNLLSNLDWPFTLIFRTFGGDLDRVLREWQEFVKGKHVCKPQGAVLGRMSEHMLAPNTGCMYRVQDELYLCLGPSVSVSSTQALKLRNTNAADAATIIAELRKIPNCSSVKQTSFRTLNEELVRYYAQSNYVGGLVDYYPFWAEAAEHRGAGKVFPVPFSAAKQEDPYYVFFDDNIFIGDEKSIVDLRDDRTMENLIGDALERPFCVMVNGYEAITNGDYFIEQLSQCLELQIRSRDTSSRHLS